MAKAQESRLTLEIIVDANILLASFLKEATTRELLLDVRLSLFAPEHLISETSRNLMDNPDIKKRVHLSPVRMKELFSYLTNRIQTVPASSYRGHFQEALLLAPHKEDAHYFALSLLFGIPIWTNDKGFKSQDKIKIYSTGELIDFLGNWK